jgi:hypothetical protein
MPATTLAPKLADYCFCRDHSQDAATVAHGIFNRGYHALRRLAGLRALIEKGRRITPNCVPGIFEMDGMPISEEHLEAYAPREAA